jgi:stalled ribosome rescue protein Dom34
MTHYHALVWIDHQEARIFGIGPEESDKTAISDHAPRHHIHGRENHSGRAAMAIDSGFYREVAEGLKAARAIMIAGPGRAKTELAGYLAEHYPAIAKRIWRIEPMDHPTDNQLVTAARKYFRTEDRMHQQ